VQEAEGLVHQPAILQRGRRRQKEALKWQPTSPGGKALLELLSPEEEVATPDLIVRVAFHLGIFGCFFALVYCVSLTSEVLENS